MDVINPAMVSNDGYQLNVPTPQQPMVDMVNPYLQQLYSGAVSQGYSFGSVTSPKNVVEAEQAHISVTPQTPADPAFKEAVGLSMNGLIGNDVSPVQPQPVVGYVFNNLVQVVPVQKEEPAVPTELPQFGNLYDSSINPADVKQRFGVAPLEDGADRSMLPKVNSFEDVAHLNKNNQPVQESITGRKVNNWFTRLLDQRGQDYISSGKLTIDEVNRNAERILDDIIAGRIDYGKQGQYLINPVVIDTLISYCANKLAINRAIQYSLGYVYNDYTNRILMNDPERLAMLASIDDSQSRNISQAIAIVNQDIGIFDILYQKLQYVAATRNASSLFSLTNDLNNWRKQTKKRY